MASPVSDSARDPAELAIELRTSVTPVIGYLELLGGGVDLVAEEQLRWLETIERRLGAIEELSDELQAMCARFRERYGTS